jgi:hypothetical protein
LRLKLIRRYIVILNARALVERDSELATNDGLTRRIADAMIAPLKQSK